MIFRFESFDLDDQAGTLRREGEPVDLQPKPLALLTLLLRERDRIVPLDELFETLWPGVAVTPGSLNRAVSHARRAIGDTHQGALIRSYPRRGYRFCGDVVVLDAAPAVGAALPSGPEPADGDVPFVGREDALATLRGSLDQALSGRESLALISGPPGIGKSRLVDVFTREIESRGVLVLAGRCRDGEGVPAFWPWVQIVRRLLAEPSMADDVRRLVEPTGELAGLVPEFGEPATQTAARMSPDRRRFQFFEAVESALQRASRQRPLVVVIEDLHWAGSPSLRLLEHLAFETEADPILILATARDEPRERSHPLTRTLSILRQQDRTAQVVLGGLSRADVGTYLERRLGRPAPSDLTSELFARTEGVPLFLRAALRLLDERGDLERPEQIARQGIALPAEALDLIRRGLERLSESCHDLVAAAAVIGREFSLPLVCAVAEVPRDQGLDLVDEATRAGVVEAAPEEPATWRFSHALFQESAYASLAPGLRVRLHYRVAERLERQHADHPDRVVAELAHHRHRSLALSDPEQAHASACRAAEKARALCAFELAAAHHQQALDALDHCESVAPGRRLELQLALGEALRLAGDRDRRRDVLTEAMAEADRLERPLDYARAAIGFCDLSAWGTRDDTAYAHLGEALDQIDETPRIERARLLTRRAYLDIRHGRDRSEPTARRALALARRVADPEALQEALYTLHFAIGGPDDLDERAELIVELVALADRTPSRDPALIASLDLASDRLQLGDVAGARRYRQQAMAILDADPHPGQLWHLAVYDTGMALLEGRFAEVESGTRDAMLLGERAGHPYARGIERIQLALLHRARGDHDRTAEILEPARGWRLGAVQWAHAVLGRAQLALGDEAAARSILDGLAVDAFRAIPRNLRWAGTVVEAAGLCADLEDRERAVMLEELLAPVERQHGVLPVPICYGGPVSHVLGRLAEIRGDTDDALAHLADAAASCTALGAEPTLVGVQRDRARLLRRAGSRDEASAAAEQAREIAERIGMPEAAQSA